jgi:hypothetical protein
MLGVGYESKQITCCVLSGQLKDWRICVMHELGSSLTYWHVRVNNAKLPTVVFSSALVLKRLNDSIGAQNYPWGGPSRDLPDSD